MDGAHQAGRRAAEKRGKPQGSRPVTSETPVEELSSILTQAGKQKAKRKGPLKGVVDPEFGKRLPEDRRIVMVVRQRSGKKGKGANGTRVAIAMAETATEAEGILATYAAIPESYLDTDSSPAYASSASRSWRTERWSTPRSFLVRMGRTTTRLRNTTGATTGQRKAST